MGYRNLQWIRKSILLRNAHHRLTALEPYLLSLGMSKALLAIVWIIGPLSGTIVQPYIGIKSDNSRSRIGKRKPFMIGGATATLISFLALAWTREIVHGFLGFFGADPHSQSVKVASICFAIGWVCLLDVAINTGRGWSPTATTTKSSTPMADRCSASWNSRLHRG